jgi:hypothetical protein
MRKLSYVFYFVLVASIIGCNYKPIHEKPEMPSTQKIWLRYADNTTDTLTIDYREAQNLRLNYNQVLYSCNKVYCNDVKIYATDVRTYGKCN